MANANIYKVITDKMVERIEDAIENKKSFSWVKSWKGYPTGNFMSFTKNADKFREYRGINRLLLEPGLYITMKQIDELAKKDGTQYKVAKGTKAQTVYFYKKNVVDKKDADGNVVKDEKGNPIKTAYFLMRFYNVFNINDVEGFEDYQIPGLEHEYTDTELSKAADKIIKAYAKRDGVVVKTQKGSDRAYYTPKNHTVIVPAKSQFDSIEEYYSTVFHELTHSTSKKLERELGKKFGEEKYSFEELVAELGALFLMQTVGFDTSKTEINSTAYLKGWLKQLKNDTGLIVKASNKAQAALDYILDTKFENEENVTEEDDTKVA